ncbi:hypothetical protein [Flavobacterium petrolei]|uniref:hypothetical protein n=1 Tax=Flavobacterium petrolei TaxID=2259594 RepID=UPI003756A72D
MKTKSDYQFDFSLFINDKIICQRFFNDNKYDKNQIDFNKAIEIITVTTGLIKDFLKSESIELLWKNYDSYNQKKMLHKETKNDLLKVTISYNSNLIASSCIEGYIYAPKVKYKVDIRPIIPVIFSNIRLCLIK